MRKGASLRGRLATVMSLLLVLVLVLALVGVTTLSWLDRRATATIATLVEAGNLTSELSVAIATQLQLADRELSEPSPETARRLHRIADSSHQLQRRVRQLPSLEAADQSLLNDLAALQARIEVDYAGARALADLGRDAEAGPLASRARAATDSLQAKVQALMAANAGHAISRADALRAESARRRTVLWFLFFSALLIGITSAWMTIRSVDGPLSRLVAATQRFGGGDLRPADLGGMPAELTALGSAINGMASRIRQMMAAITGESREIAASAGDFSAMSQELAATAGQVSEAMVHLAEAAEGQVRSLRDADAGLAELRDADTSTLRAAQRVTSIGRSITAMAEDHRVHVEAASATLLALRETVRASATEVREATRLTDTLTGLVERDRQLATKVGVLAVNTSIEAARAGVHGQGITAVAEELRLLGEMCEAAAEQGEQAVARLQAQVQATAATLESGTTAVLGVEATAQRAASALAEIVRGVAAVNQAAGQVVQDATRARAGIAAMLERTAAVARAAADHAVTGETVSAAAEEQAAATQEMATAAARLNDAAQRLIDLTRDFRA